MRGPQADLSSDLQAPMVTSEVTSGMGQDFTDTPPPHPSWEVGRRNIGRQSDAGRDSHCYSLKDPWY